MSEDFGEIRPKSVPLTHSAPERPSASTRPSLRPLAAGASVLLVMATAFVVFVVVPDLVQPPTLPGTPATDTAGATSDSPRPAARDEKLPPFQALMKEQARARAQEELARFVELQLDLEQTMQVGQWGQAEYDAAKRLATAGDEQFLGESFEAAIESYAKAATALAALIEDGKARFASAMRDGRTALERRDEKNAAGAFARALTISPDDQEAQQGARRAVLLPEVNTAMREAKNHELAAEYRDALAVYERVRAMDPKTAGLEAGIRAARAGIQAETVKGHLSSGFAALEAGRLDAARAAFGQALKLDPGNPVALGGLEQVDDASAGRRLATLRGRAEAAEAAEDWETALQSYVAVLESDGNIQFARDGRQRALAQRRAATGLSRIAASPEKLSSPELFDQASDLLDDAMALTPRGPRLDARIREVTALLAAYRDPIPVVFVSDNRTQVTLSTIGRLGSFERKQLDLRPGSYTVIGSRDGCRDVRADIVVKPNMQPVDIRCTERL